MTEGFNNLFVDVENKFNGMERKKLKELNQIAEKDMG